MMNDEYQNFWEQDYTWMKSEEMNERKTQEDQAGKLIQDLQDDFNASYLREDGRWNRVDRFKPATDNPGEAYKNATIQPVDYIQANNLNFLEGNVVKYVTRHKNKGGADDIRKAIHYLQMILKKEYGGQ